jgi:integrase
MPAEQAGSVYATKTRGWGVRWREHGQWRYQSGFRTKTEARAYYRDEVRPRLRRSAEDPLRITFGDLADRYVEAHAADCEPITSRNLRSRLARPRRAFGDASLVDLERRVPEIAAFRSSLPEKSAYAIMQAFSQVLEGAVGWGLVATNPVRRAGKTRQPRRAEVVPFTRAEVDAIAAELGPHGPMIVFAAETGMRPSEWLALEWDDVNRDSGEARIERTYSVGRLKPYGKTTRSRRVAPLSTRALAALDQVPRRIGSRALVFASPSGGHLDLHNWRNRQWRPALFAAGVDHGTIYTLRHTFATNAPAAGLGLYELSRYMGTSLRMIDATYGHLEQGSVQAARVKLDAFVR